jgi:hypothetical protein
MMHFLPLCSGLGSPSALPVLVTQGGCEVRRRLVRLETQNSKITGVPV